ncbi:imelysin family protein [Aliikangiella maris]|uniref:Imelysin family protein n=2 Tax=Aliikangiella maris TaxID=3162458 RepID=A0ABV2BYP1_9GAMM
MFNFRANLVSSMSLAAALLMLSFIYGCGGGGGSEPNDDDFTAGSNKVDEQVALLRYLGNDVFVPGYQSLAQASVELVNSAQVFCSSSSLSATELSQLRHAWLTVMDKWQLLQIMRFGPIVKNNYQYRIQFWPDDNNAVTNNIENLLSGTQVITESVVANTSVGAQGLPAIEYLIFKADEQVLAEFSDSNTAARRCQLLNAITLNLQTITADLVDRWLASGEDFISDFTGKGIAGSGDTSKLDEMVSDVVNTLIEQAQFILLNKLQAPLGDNIPGYTQAAESWRSEYSKANLVNNLKAFKVVYGENNFGFSRYLNEVVEADVLDANMQERLQQLVDISEQIEGTYSQALASQTEREKISQLVELMQSLIVKLEGDLAKAMNATVGFNGNDGD